MASSRISVIGDSGLGEPEQDANSALTELDKGLRSGNVGEQCEAIVRFPRLFEKYPFPILINSSFLKLADVFRAGSNFMRVWVLRVCQQSEKHLDKILSVDEFVRRVFSVTHSNDPVARALALHVLGSVASIIPEREQVHHSIRNSLDSHDTVEVLAAVCSAAKFAAHSRMFAVSMCNKIAAMIQGLDTPAELKLKLIPVLQHMHYTTSTAAMVRELGGELLQSYPAKDFILTSHDTLTKLAEEALVDIPHQVSLLLSSLEGESRVEVQLHVLRELKILARASHWPAGAVNALVARARESANSSKGSAILASCLDVLSVLAKSATFCHEQLHPDSALLDLCIQSCYSLQPKIVSKAICILTSISCYCYDAGLPPLPAGAALECALESFLLLLISQPSRHIRELTMCLKCVLQLCEACPTRCQYFVQLISEQMQGHMDKPNQTIILLMETLAAIASINPNKAEPPILLHLLPELLACINCMPPDASQGSLVCTLILQTCQGYALSSEVCSSLYKYSQRCSVWECYKLARVAMRYGQHMLAVPAITRLTHSVSSEHFHFWLMSLQEISLAECALLGEKPVSLDNMMFSEHRTIANNSSTLIERLTQATTHYAKAIASVKAASTPQNWLHFAAEYLRLRLDTLQCLSQLVQACLSLTHPPPAIAMNQAQTSNDDLLRHGRTTSQLRKVALEFRVIADNHAKLAQSAFDADPKTLANIKILKNMCLLLSRSIDSIATTNYQERNMIDFGNVKDCPEMHHIVSSCNQAAKISEDINNNRALKPIAVQHIESLLQQVEIVVASPLCFPRYFFQVLQCTSVKLSISPQSRLVGEITVQANTQMVLRVEGVCQHQGRPGLFRTITGIKLALNYALQSSRTAEPTKDGSTNITQIVNPHHDFFSAQFLLAFSQGGQYQICITASIIDAEGHLWRTGPKTYLVVKVYEDQSAASTAAIQALNKSFPPLAEASRSTLPAPRF